MTRLDGQREVCSVTVPIWYCPFAGAHNLSLQLTGFLIRACCGFLGVLGGRCWQCHANACPHQYWLTGVAFLFRSAATLYICGYHHHPCIYSALITVQHEHGCIAGGPYPEHWAVSTAFTPCDHPVKTVTDPSDQGVIATNYQWLPENTSSIVYYPFPFQISMMTLS